jgi:hypothetical protein
MNDQPDRSTTVLHNIGGRFDSVPVLAKRLGIAPVAKGEGALVLEVRRGERYDILDMIEKFFAQQNT